MYWLVRKMDEFTSGKAMKMCVCLGFAGPDIVKRLNLIGSNEMKCVKETLLLAALAGHLLYVHLVVRQHAHHNILWGPRQAVAVLFKAANDSPGILQTTDFLRAHRIATAPVQALAWHLLVGATRSMVRPIGGALHQLVKVDDALGSVGYCVKVHVVRASIPTGQRYVLLSAALRYIPA